MLNPRKDVQIYSDHLKPPLGFELDHAITTTYSLDLTAILFLPVALYFSQDVAVEEDKAKSHNIPAILEGLTRVGKQITLYCQKGKIAVPDSYNKLMAYWENSIHEIQMPNAMSSFHPKIWLIKFMNSTTQAVKYRFICTSRNLTLNRDWDVAFIVEGEYQSNTSAKNKKERATHNKPLKDFILYLSHEQALPAQMMLEVDHILWENAADFDFAPIINFGNINHLNPLRETTSPKAKKRLAISPFLDQKTLKNTAAFSEELIILGRAEEINVLPKKLFTKDTYSFNSRVIDGEQTENMESNQYFTQQLHAKYYLDEFENHTVRYIGSANYTAPASRENIEFLISEKLEGSDHIETLLNELTIDNGESHKGLFVKHEFEMPSETEDESQVLRKLIYDICEMKITGVCEQKTDTRYIVSVYLNSEALKDFNDTFKISFRPLPAQHASQKLNNEAGNYIFGPFSLLELSPFLVFRIETPSTVKEFVVSMNIELPDGRTENILKSLIDSSDKFLAHLSFLLNGQAMELPQLMKDAKQDDEHPSDINHSSIPTLVGIDLYEDLLKASSRSPHHFEHIATMLETLKDEKDDNGNPIVDSELLKIWDVFYAYISPLEKTKMPEKR